VGNATEKQEARKERPEVSNLWFWYFARPNELLCDLDSEYAVASFCFKLKRAVRNKSLRVKDALIRESNAAGKYHAVVVLRNELSEGERILWQTWLGSDRVRELYNAMRVERGVSHPNLLIRRHAIKEFRNYDAVCKCDGKHKGLAKCRACPVMRKIHGKDAGKAYFPLAEKVTIQKGRLSLRWLQGETK
jgi:hypothetical protein